jgi:drug/metabolite transporter (DMT)-like permease
MHPLRGILLKVISVMVFVTMAVLIKAAAAEVPPGEAVFFRSFFAIPVIFAWLAWTGHLADGLRTRQPLAHVWRGLISTAGMGLGFAGLGLLPLPEVTAIGYAAPLLVVILAAMFLGEQVRVFRLSAVAIGLVGVLIVLSPRLTAMTDVTDLRHALGALVVLGSAFFAALAQVFVRKMVHTESISAIVFYFSVSGSVLSLITLPYGWAWPSWPVALMLVMAGLLGGLGQILLTSAYRFADVSVIAPFEYTSMLLTLVIGYVVFGEAPTLPMLVGAALVIFAGVLVIWRERQLGLERAKGRQAGSPHG